MRQIIEYQRQAEEAERRARNAVNEAERRGFAEIAEGWRLLEREAQRRVDRGY